MRVTTRRGEFTVGRGDPLACSTGEGFQVRWPGLGEDQKLPVTAVRTGCPGSGGH